MTAGEDLACGRCGAPHHPDCWEYAGGCSVYACGETGTRPLRDAGAGDLMVLDEASAPASVPVERARALARYVRAHAVDMPRCIAWGLGGMGMGIFSLALFDQGMPPVTIAVFLASGLLHGIVSPFLARLQHRRPGAVGGVAVVTFALLTVWLEQGARLPVAMEMVSVLLMLLSWMVASSSLADLLAGPRSWLGPRLGRGQGPARLLLAWGAALGTFMLWPLLLGYPYLDPLRFGRIAFMAAMVATSGIPALERGKSAYLERLPPGRR